jgi:hypothetical protein
MPTDRCLLRRRTSYGQFVRPDAHEGVKRQNDDAARPDASDEGQHVAAGEMGWRDEAAGISPSG